MTNEGEKSVFASCHQASHMRIGMKNYFDQLDCSLNHEMQHKFTK